MVLSVMGSSVCAGLPIFVASLIIACRMGFFSFLFRRRFYMGDAFFGRLLREEIDPHAGRALFVAEAVLFTPTSQRIACFLDAPETGPTEAQRDFYRRIERRYDRLAARLITVFEQAFHHRAPSFRVYDFAAEFQLIEISLPDISAEPIGPISWQWSFSSVHDDIHTFTVYMHGDVPDPDVVMDG